MFAAPVWAVSISDNSFSLGLKLFNSKACSSGRGAKNLSNSAASSADLRKTLL